MHSKLAHEFSYVMLATFLSQLAFSLFVFCGCTIAMLPKDFHSDGEECLDPTISHARVITFIGLLH